jgi:site-specific recombinase XerD
MKKLQNPGAAACHKSEEKKYRGVFEKEPGSGVWWIQYFDADGKRHREKVGAKGSAIKLVELRRGARLEGRKLPKLRTRPLFFRELTAAALAHTEGKSGHATNVSRMKSLTAQFGNYVAEEISPEQIERWLAAMTFGRSEEKKRPVALATKNRYIALLKLVFRLAERARRIKFNPARMLRQEKENNARIRWLSDAEEKMLRDVILRDHPDRIPELDIAVHTGMRLSEQYAMTWENVNFASGIITVPQSKHGEVRHVRMNSRVRLLLTVMKEKSVGTGQVFPSGPRLRVWFEPAVAAAKIANFTWHCLRHTFISRLVMAGVDLRTVQVLAGHKTIAMTCRYAHLSAEHEQAAVEKLTQVPPIVPPKKMRRAEKQAHVM